MLWVRSRTTFRDVREPKSGPFRDRLKRQGGGNLREGDTRRIPPKRNVHWKSCYLRKRVAIIRVKWPLLLLIREALAKPKKALAGCGNSEMVELVRVKVIPGVT
jgi:hypothetical protein